MLVKIDADIRVKFDFFFFLDTLVFLKFGLRKSFLSMKLLT